MLQYKCSSDNLVMDLSDHFTNFTIFDIKAPSIKDRPYIRLDTQNNIDKFNDSKNSEQPLISSGELTDTENSFNTLSSNYSNLFDKYFPYVRMYRKEFKNKPHITKGIKVSIRTKK